MTTSEIKVSLIVPIYNVEKYIGNCIETILCQTHTNLEIILVNDGSQDSSGCIVEDYAAKDKRIKVIHQKNSGVSTARNAGLDAATGDYVCFVDGDDYIMPDYVEYMLNIALANETDIALTTEMFGNFKLDQVKEDKIDLYSAEEATIGILCYRIPIGVYCKIFKRSFLEENKIRFLKELYIGEGFNFNTSAFQRAKLIGVGRRRIYYYRRDNSTSATTKFSIDKWINGLMAIEVIKRDFIIHTNALDNAWKFANWRTHSDVYDIMVLASAQDQHPEMYKKCLNITRTNALCSLTVPTSLNQRLRALVLMVCPSMIPKMMILRRKRYNADVNN